MDMVREFLAVCSEWGFAFPSSAEELQYRANWFARDDERKDEIVEKIMDAFEAVPTDEGQGYVALTHEAGVKNVAAYWSGEFTAEEVVNWNGTQEDRAKRDAWFRQAVDFIPLAPRGAS